MFALLPRLLVLFQIIGIISFFSNQSLTTCLAFIFIFVVCLLDIVYYSRNADEESFMFCMQRDVGHIKISGFSLELFASTQSCDAMIKPHL